MNYYKIYHQLIDRAKGRVLSGYVEVHHIKPKCIGGSNDSSNLVQLTPEEHYLTHQLLHKMYPNVSGLAFAMVAMTGTTNGDRNNKLYGWVRRKCAIAQSAQSTKMWQDPKYREKHRKAMAVAMQSPAFKAKISKIHKGRVKSAKERANIAEAGRNRKPRVFSEQARKNMAEARKKTWAERKANGTHLEIAAKTKATRIKNGSYNFTDAHKKAIGESGKGRTPWNKGKKLR